MHQYLLEKYRLRFSVIKYLTLYDKITRGETQVVLGLNKSIKNVLVLKIVRFKDKYMRIGTTLLTVRYIVDKLVIKACLI